MAPNTTTIPIRRRNQKQLWLLQLRSALPSHWKRLLQSADQTQQRSKPLIRMGDQAEMDLEKISTSKIYEAIIILKIASLSSQAKWEALLPIEGNAPQDYWREIYKLPYQVSRETKMQAFQFRLLHRILPCSKYLYTITIRQDDLCLNCSEQDTLKHFLFYCPKVREYWSNLELWFLNNTDLRLCISTKNILFGHAIIRPSDKATNTIILVAKFYIYRQWLFHDTDINIPHFLLELRAKLKTEKYICRLEGKSNKFNVWKQTFAAMG